LESKLIEVMKMKIHPIQFVSVVNLIQIQSTQLGDPVPNLRSTKLADANSE
jgi:hypothetical protein